MIYFYTLIIIDMNFFPETNKSCQSWLFVQALSTLELQCIYQSFRLNALYYKLNACHSCDVGQRKYTINVQSIIPTVKFRLLILLSACSVCRKWFQTYAHNCICSYRVLQKFIASLINLKS